MRDEILFPIPTMLYGDELYNSIKNLPPYHKSITYFDTPSRLIALEELYNIYVPSHITNEIYSKLYLSMLSSLRKKQTKESVIQQNTNYKTVCGNATGGIMGGFDSFTIIGKSGIGKSTTISRSLSLMKAEQIIETSNPYSKIIPCLTVQCPFDSSVKGLLLGILLSIDEKLGTTYFINATKARASTDVLIGSVSQVAINHIGLLVVDEIQNVVNSKNGKNLIGSLTQLINNSGISICMVGTPECVPFFKQDMKLARRSLGLYFEDMPFDLTFTDFCGELLKYIYVRKPLKNKDAIIYWLYEHSGGNTSTVVTLIHDSQEIAMLDGSESLDIESLSKAYGNRLKMLHSFKEKDRKPTVKKNTELILPNNTDFKKDLIGSLYLKSKSTKEDFAEMLKAYIAFEEVKL